MVLEYTAYKMYPMMTSLQLIPIRCKRIIMLTNRPAIPKFSVEAGVVMIMMIQAMTGTDFRGLTD